MKLFMICQSQNKQTNKKPQTKLSSVFLDLLAYLKKKKKLNHFKFRKVCETSELYLF